MTSCLTASSVVLAVRSVWTVGRAWSAWIGCSVAFCWRSRAPSCPACPSSCGSSGSTETSRWTEFLFFCGGGSQPISSLLRWVIGPREEGEKNCGGRSAVNKNINVHIFVLICEDSVRPEFGRQNQLGKTPSNTFPTPLFTGLKNVWLQPREFSRAIERTETTTLGNHRKKVENHGSMEYCRGVGRCFNTESKLPMICSPVAHWRCSMWF